MKTIVVTGGVGTGKSSVCEDLLRSGNEDVISVFSADGVVRDAYGIPVVRRQIACAVGLDETLAELGPDEFKSHVRQAVLRNPSSRLDLETVLHPLVWRAFTDHKSQSSRAGIKVLVAEIPLYYETGASVAADTVVVVAASRATQLYRLQSRRSLDQDTAEGMLLMQMPLSEKVERSDVVIWNDGSRDALNAQVTTLLRRANF